MEHLHAISISAEHAQELGQTFFRLLAGFAALCMIYNLLYANWVNAALLSLVVIPLVFVALI